MAIAKVPSRRRSIWRNACSIDRTWLINFFHAVSYNLSIGVRKKAVITSILQHLSKLLMIRDHPLCTTAKL